VKTLELRETIRETLRELLLEGQYSEAAEKLDPALIKFLLGHDSSSGHGQPSYKYPEAWFIAMWEKLPSWLRNAEPYESTSELRGVVMDNIEYFLDMGWRSEELEKLLRNKIISTGEYSEVDKIGTREMHLKNMCQSLCGSAMWALEDLLGFIDNNAMPPGSQLARYYIPNELAKVVLGNVDRRKPKKGPRFLYPWAKSLAAQTEKVLDSVDKLEATLPALQKENLNYDLSWDAPIKLKDLLTERGVKLPRGFNPKTASLNDWKKLELDLATLSAAHLAGHFKQNPDWFDTLASISSPDNMMTEDMLKTSINSLCNTALHGVQDIQHFLAHKPKSKAYSVANAVRGLLAGCKWVKWPKAYEEKKLIKQPVELYPDWAPKVEKAAEAAEKSIASLLTKIPKRLR